MWAIKSSASADLVEVSEGLSMPRVLMDASRIPSVSFPTGGRVYQWSEVPATTLRAARDAFDAIIEPVLGG